MQPLALILNIAILVAIIGIIVYWVRRFAVFLGYKAIQPDVLQIAELLKTDAVREGSDVVVAGHYGGFPTIVRFSHRVDTPGLDIQMRVPASFNFSLTPKAFSSGAEGRVLARTGSAALDRRFSARTDHPLEFKMVTAVSTTLGGLEQLCCSTQTGFVVKDRTMELSELTIPPFTANHVFDHLQSMLAVARSVREMPGADQIKIEPLPRRGSSWPVRVALAGGLACLVALLFTQPYSHPAGANANVNPPQLSSGVPPADAARLQQLEGWHVARVDEFSGAALRFFREHNLEPSGHIQGDFGGRGSAADSAYLLIDNTGRRRVSLLAKGQVAYDAIFPQADFLARVSKSNLAKIQWMSQAPQFTADGDALLVVQNANDPTASMVLLRHGTQTYSASPADFSKIDLVSE
ncbi:MAG TPA: hypothetical protein VKL99_13760 [Candidatus Angelobacter sp.]|nr:hypothetical protein [Candidatus Angelobacter sp.]